MTRVLIIYESVPDDLELYSLFVTDEELTMLRACHGKYVNSDDLPDDHPINQLSVWLAEKEDNRIYKGSEQDGKQIQIELSEVIVTGFIL
jgi:hypothetical protein